MGKIFEPQSLSIMQETTFGCEKSAIDKDESGYAIDGSTPDIGFENLERSEKLLEKDKEKKEWPTLTVKSNNDDSCEIRGYVWERLIELPIIEFCEPKKKEN